MRRPTRNSWPSSRRLAKKYKFANYDEYDTVAGNIALVLDGVDPKTKKYIGTEAAIKQQIADIKANKDIAAKDKKQQIADLNEEMKSITPIKFKSNIDLVLKYYDQLSRRRRPEDVSRRADARTAA